MANAAKQIGEEWTTATQDRDRRRELGQFFTPRPVADFMASLFAARRHEVNVLDAGAGEGALSAALVRRLCDSPHKPEKINITAYELDPELIGRLQISLNTCRRECEHAGIMFSATVLNVDFIASAVSMARGGLFTPDRPSFNAAIVNPPYRKIRGDSAARLLLRSAAIETGNLYTGFVALITKLLVDGGELVAITPRSFCNGLYFKPFRQNFLETMALRRLHVFDSRSAAFKTDDVLQENIIVHAVKEKLKPDRIVISSSSGEPGGKVAEREVAYRDVVSPGDSEQFIHLAGGSAQDAAQAVIQRLSTPLAKLGLSVSTGRVVDFRAREYLRQQPGHGTAPLLYPCHFNGATVIWPKEKSRKANAIVNNEQTRELLVPAGVYVLVKRFTAKEERKRVVACVYDPPPVHSQFVGFENHLNYFHVRGGGLPVLLAKGLTTFLNSTIVDTYFRQFNGHTQVNATDLRNLNYPTQAELERLGRHTPGGDAKQDDLDALVAQELS